MKKLYAALIIGIGLNLSGCQHLPSNTVFMSQNTSDSSLTTAINNAFAENRLLAQVPINIDTNNGVVKLSGYVKTIRQSDVAAEVASKVSGVKMVENNLIVRK